MHPHTLSPKMSDRLSVQLNAFKSKLKGSSATLPNQKRIIHPPPKAEPPARISSPLRQHQDNLKRRVEAERKVSSVESEVKRQKATNESLAGSHLSTQLHLAVEYIKQQEDPISLTQLEGYLSVPVVGKLLPLLESVDRIRYDKAKQTIEFASLHNIRSTNDLLHFLRTQPTFRGLSVKELKDGWPSCMDAIDDLEEEEKILVLRTKKDNVPRCVWFNHGGPLGIIDDDFVEMWSSIRVPQGAALQAKLLDNGLKPTSVDPASIKKNQPVVQEMKKKKPRKGKITNTHMKGILQDYSSRVK